MPVTIYFDGSGHHAGAPFMRLASIGAGDGPWDEFRRKWNGLLAEHNLAYCHLKELAHGKQKGRTREEIHAFLKQAAWLSCVNFHQAKRFLREIDMSAYRQAQAQRPAIKPAAELCLDHCFGRRILLPGEEARGDVIRVVFDRGEPSRLHNI